MAHIHTYAVYGQCMGIRNHPALIPARRDVANTLRLQAFAVFAPSGTYRGPLQHEQLVRDLFSDPTFQSCFKVASAGAAGWIPFGRETVQLRELPARETRCVLCVPVQSALSTSRGDAATFKCG
jgi:hypothetical protein